MIIAIGQKRYDVPNALWAADIIKRTKPDCVAIELPAEFQSVINRYYAGKIPDKDLDEAFGKLMGRKLELDDKLFDKFEKKKVKKADLERYSPDGAFVHIIIAAKSAGSKVECIDVPLQEVMGEVEKRIAVKGKTGKKVLSDAERSMAAPSRNLVLMSEFIHTPFHIFEMIVGHHPEESPFEHDPECKICKMGVDWERFWHGVLAKILDIIPGDQADYLVALNKYDRIREEKIAKKVAKLQNKHDNILLIVHSWHEMPIEKELKKIGCTVKELPS